MLGLPKTTELNRQLPKKSIFTKFTMNSAAQDKFDADIRRLTIIHEISPTTMNFQMGREIKSFYVLLVSMRHMVYDEKNIALVAKLIDQNMLFLLEYEGKVKLAIYRTKLMESEWVPIDELSIQLSGLDMDAVWENIILQIGRIKIEQGKTLDEQICLDEERAKVKKKIELLEKQAWKEMQPKKKLKLVQQISILRKDLL